MRLRVPLRLRVPSWLFIIALTLMLVLIACGGTSPSDEYHEGLLAAQAGEWDAAVKKFDQAGSYQDAPQRSATAQANLASLTSNYDTATKAVNDRRWADALVPLQTVSKLSPSYKDSVKLLAQTTEELDKLIGTAESAVASGDMEGAISAYTKAGTYKNATILAADLSAAKSRLDQLYGMMTAAFNAKDYAAGFEAAAEILKLRPGYRDTTAIVDSRLLELYNTADTALAAGDIKTAVKHFTLVIKQSPNFKDSAIKLGTAKVLLMRAAPGNYPIGAQLDPTSICIFCSTINGKVSSIDVNADGSFRVNIEYLNQNKSNYRLGCASTNDDDKAYLRLADGSRVSALQTFCSQHRGEVFSILPGGKLETYGVFPKLADATKAFSVIWYETGETDEIVLVKVE